MRFAELVIDGGRGEAGEWGECVALVDEGGSRETSWNELHALVRAVSAYAVAQGLKGIVPLCMKRSRETVAALLGLNLAGVGVAPLAADAPAGRVRAIEEQTGNAAWTMADFRRAVAAAESPAPTDEGVGSDGARPEEAAYVVFTSGSTGKPKGVVLSDDAIASAIVRSAGPAFFDSRRGEHVLQTASFAFIAVAADLFAPLSAGSTVHLLPDDARKDPQLFEAYLRDHDVKAAFIAPQMLARIGEVPSLRVVCTGSDRVSGLGPRGYILVNVYGLSECGGFGSAFEVRHPYEATPIGIFHPASSGIRSYIVDEDGSLAREGELCLSGALASGYLGLPELTAAVFVPNPFCDDAGHEVLFHTGDLVRQRDEGSMDFLGRRDFMLKINGQRVEPGEAEATLRRVEGVRNAAVRGFSEPGASSYLCAYYVADEELDPASLRAALETELPAYLVPSYFVRLAELPLNANGKVDYRALEAPAVRGGGSEGRVADTGGDGDEGLPANEAEAAVCEAFETVLGIGRVAPTADFLVLGGNSFLAMDAASLLANRGVRPADVLALRTPRAIAVCVQARAAEHAAPASGESDEACAGVRSDGRADPSDAFGASDASGDERDPMADLPCGLQRVPLTDSQMGIFLSCSMEPKAALYNIPFALSLPRPEGLDSGRAKRAIDAVIAAHPALLACIEEGEDEVLMVRRDMPPAGIAVAEEGDDARFAQLCDRPLEPFDLAAGPLVRAHAVLTRTQLHVLFDMHHIVSDGSSVAVICRQLAEFLADGTPPKESVDAFALLELERRRAGEVVRTADAAFFEQMLAGEETDSNLLFDFRPDDGRPAACDQEDGEAPCAGAMAPCGREDLTLKLPGMEGLLREAGLTESSAFTGAFGYALAKMTGQDKALFAVAESGRGDARLGDTVGMLVRTLPLLLPVDETQTMADFLQTVQERAFGAFAHDTASFGELCRCYGISSDVMFVYQGDLFGTAGGAGERVACRPLPAQEAIANLSVQVLKSSPSTYTAAVEYRSDRYRPETIERFMLIFENALRSFTGGEPLSAVPLVSDAELAALDACNKTEDPYDATRTVVDDFRARATDGPERTCVVSGNARYSYEQTDELSDRIAANLRARGIGRGDAVPVLIPRNEYMVIASIGVLKAGAMYQPLDPSYPADRLAFMCEDAAARLLIADRELAKLLPDFAGDVLHLDELPELPAVSSRDRDDLATAAPKPEDGCVLLYTSGTTGTPKGCVIMHGNLQCFVHGFSRFRGIGRDSVAGTYASYGFDAHLGDIYPCITKGGCVHIIPEEMRLDLPALHEYAVRAKFTHMVITTQVGRQFAMEFPNIPTMESLLVGGETLVPFEPECSYRVENGYGPSECTVAATAFPVDRLYATVPIGAALPNNRLYVVDGCGRRVPAGVPGELIICGPQVARGYLNRPEKTREVFVSNSFELDAPAPYDRCYRTGDVVRFLDDGIVEFIGRRDTQVKVRGFRIELPEVERVIRDYPGIRDATVVARDDATGKCVHAYVVADEPVDIEAMNRFIRERKPPYMVPAATMQVEAIPYTPNMKVDKRKLPPIPAGGAGGIGAGDEGASDASRSLTVLEEELAALVSEVLDVPGVGVETDLTLAGLTSVTSIKLSVKLYNRYGLRLASSELLDGCTVLKIENALVAQLLDAARAVDAEPTGSEAAAAADSPDSAQGSAERAATVHAAPDAANAGGAERYPLSQVQMGIYLDCLRTGTDAYVIPMLLKLPQGIDEERLARAVERAVRAHPSLLAHIRATGDGDVFQYPMPAMPVTVERELRDPADMPPALTSFAFGEAPLFRIRLIRAGDERYLFFEAHHIIFDGSSRAILLEDIDAAYRGMAPEAERYTAFQLAAEEQMLRTPDALARAKEAYAGVFQGVADDYRPCADRFGDARRGIGERTAVLDAASVARACNRAQVTENVFFTGAFAHTLARYTAHEDALFATIHNGRTDPRTARMASMLVRTVPLFVPAGDDLAVGDFLRSIADLLQLLKRNDAYSFADAAREFGVNADVIFIYQGSILEGPQLDGLALEEVSLAIERPKASLSVEVFEEDGSYRFHAEYDEGRYSAELVASFLDALDTCAAQLAQLERLGEVELCSADALARFDAFNDTAWEVPYRPACRLLEDSARRVPDTLAVVAGDERLTYRQLDCRANRLAHALLDAGIPIGSVVEVIAPRCAGVYVAQNGILKAGSAFLFLAPAYPDERIAFVSEDAQAAAIVTTRAIARERAELFARIGCPLFFLEDVADAEAAGVQNDPRDGSPAVDRGPDDPAYLIYTSGTTGKPKGIVVRQRGLANLVHANPVNEQILCMTQDSPVAAAVTAFTFDASVFEEFIALAHGMTVVIAGDEEIHNPVAFAKLCLDTGITTMTATASFFLSNLDYPGFADVVRQLKCIVQGGEVFPRALYEALHELNPELRMVNSYGPSETTVSCSSKTLDSPDRITIGTPIANTRIYMLDSACHILPMGALGEMVVLGDGVGLGYLNRPERTAHAFIEYDGQPAYRTGDLAIIGHDGQIEFHGRADDQVKLRGLRVELGEIEHAIEACDGVTRAVVTVHGDERNRYLAAYFTAEGDVAADAITAQISLTLAEYMVPRVFIRMDAMPLTANGKVDKRALPEPQLDAQEREYVKPATDTERLLCDAFADVLGVERVGATDDFFSLGGTSLTASKLAMFALSHGMDLVYADIFAHPTPRGLAALAGDAAAESAPDGGATGDDAAALGDSDAARTEAAGLPQAGGSRSAGPQDASARRADPLSRAKAVPSARAGGYTRAAGGVATGLAASGIVAIPRALEGNTAAPDDDPGHRPLGPVLLTGATGFLGVHVLNKLLEDGESEVYCLMRAGAFATLEQKLQGLYIYYFEDSIEGLFGTRIHCIEGDITDAACVRALAGIPFDTLINCAACVKHFANDDILDKVNVRGVEHLVELCLETGARLVHISTVSVAGESVAGGPADGRVLHENELYFGQLLENRYIATKFESECAVLAAVSRGLDAKIMRVGNLMPRRSDGEFQINSLTNGFMRQLRGYHALGCVPYTALAGEFEFSPIDDTAAAILALAQTDVRFTVYHANNVHRVFLADVILAMNAAGLTVEPVDGAEFARRLQAAMADTQTNDVVAGLIAYLGRNQTQHPLDYDNSFTRVVLNRLGFYWRIPDAGYLAAALEALKGFGFFDLGL